MNLTSYDFLSQIQQELVGKEVGITEFAESSRFCGKKLYPAQQVLLKLIFLEEMEGWEEDILSYWIRGGRDNQILISPKIRERRDYLRERGFKHFREVALVGGRRSSKGFVTGIAMAKLVYDCLMIDDLATHFGIDPDKEIYFSCLAAAQDQAKKYQYADFSSTIARCAAMQRNLTKLQETELSVATERDLRQIESLKLKGKTNRTRDISKLRGVALAANASTVRGSTTLCVALDEMAWMQQEGESSATAAQVYDALVPSLAQFGRASLLFCNSSPYTKLGKFYERYEEGLKLDADEDPTTPTMFVFQFPSWALYEGYQWDPKKRHKSVQMADPSWDTEQKDDKGNNFWSQADIDLILEARSEERQDPDKFKVERRGQFAEVLDAFLRPEMVERAFSGVPVPMEGGGYKRVALRLNSSAPSYKYRYKAHLDPSSTTAGFGFAMGHVEDIEDSKGEMQPHVVFDIVKRWRPEQFPSGVIEWQSVLTELTAVINVFEPYEVTLDQFQSAAPLQWLNQWIHENGLTGRVRAYEVTATALANWNRAEVFRTALYRDLVHLPSENKDTEWCERELKNLQQVNSQGRYPRVDKPSVGPVTTKDMADACFEVVYALIGNTIGTQARSYLDVMEPSFGAPGGFGIGKEGPMDNYYASGRRGTMTFREQRVDDRGGSSGKLPGKGRSGLREQLDRVTATRYGTWSTRGGQRGSRSRGR